MANIALPHDFTDLVQIRVHKLLQTITGIDKDSIFNVKKNRGAFPKKIVRNQEANGRKSVSEIPYGKEEIFAVYLINEADDGLQVYERVGDKVNGLYKFQVDLLFYGASAPFITTQLILNTASEQIRLWMQYAEMSWSEYPGAIETMDTMINNEWWLIRKLNLKLNVGITMEFPEGELIDNFEHSVISLGGIEL